MARTDLKATFMFGFLDENPIFKMVLGICSTLAVTNSVGNTFAMCVSVLFVTCCSSAMVSLMREYIPKKVRMAVYVVVIATFVMAVDNLLKAFFPTVSKAMGPYVGLIITNCIIMGRAEAYAANNPPLPSIVDAAGVSCGYGVILLLIASIRETLGFGTFLGMTVLPASIPRMMFMILAPGAFFTLGLVVWGARYMRYHRVPSPDAAGGTGGGAAAVCGSDCACGSAGEAAAGMRG